MPVEGNIISRIIDLDERAESIRVQAREEAVRIQSESVREAEKQKKLLENQTAERVKNLATEASGERALEVAKVKKEFANQVGEIKTVSPEKKDRVVLMIFAGMRGHA